MAKRMTDEEKAAKAAEKEEQERQEAIREATENPKWVDVFRNQTVRAYPVPAGATVIVSNGPFTVHEDAYVVETTDHANDDRKDTVILSADTYEKQYVPFPEENA